MSTVFASQVADAAGRGVRWLLVVCLREVRDAPRVLLCEHWREARRKGQEVSMRGWIRTRHARDDLTADLVVGPGSWRDAALAGLPHLLLALATGAPGLLRTLCGVSARVTWLYVLGIGLGVICVGTVVTLLVVAWRQGWPRWSASVYGYLLLMVLAPVGLLLQEWNTPIRDLLTSAFWSVAFPLSAAALLLAVGHWDRVRGLLTALPLAVFLWLPVLEFVSSPVRDAANLGAWLLVALATAAIIRLGDGKARVWLTVSVCLGVGLAYSYARTYHNQIPPQYAREPTISGMLGLFLPHFLSSCTLLVGPLLVGALGLEGRAEDRLAYLVAICGLWLDLAGNLAAFWWYASGRWSTIHPTWGDLVSGVPAYLGVAMYTIAVLVLVVKARRRSLHRNASSVLLALVLLVLPAMSVLPMLYGLRSIPRYWPLGLSLLNDVPKGLVGAIGVAWLLVSGWLAGGRDSLASPGVAT